MRVVRSADGEGIFVMRASDVKRSVFWVLEKVERGHGRLRRRRRAMDAASVWMRKRSDAGRAIVCRLTAVAGMRGGALRSAWPATVFRTSSMPVRRADRGAPCGDASGVRGLGFGLSFSIVDESSQDPTLDLAVRLRPGRGSEGEAQAQRRAFGGCLGAKRR